MPPQHPHPQRHLQPRWRSRLASWLRGVAETIDPVPEGLDLTGAPEFWAEHVRASARRARAQGHGYRMVQWTWGGRAPRQEVPFAPGPPDEPLGHAEPDAPPVPPAPTTPPTPGHARARVFPRQPVAPAAQHGEESGGRPEQIGARVRGGERTPAAPLVRPRRADPVSQPRPQPAQPAHRDQPVEIAGRESAPLVRPRGTGRSGEGAGLAPSAPSPARTPSLRPSDWPVPPPVPALAAPSWPDAWPAPGEAVTPVPPVVRPGLRPRNPEGPESPDGPAPAWPAAPRPEPVALRPAVPATPGYAPAAPEDRPAAAVLPESLWPELPARRPAMMVAPDPAPVMVRRERLAAEQAAT